MSRQIGKFGVGFKAVYSYTTAPRVYSGPFRFEIQELFCPYPLYEEEPPFSIDPKRTYFTFPFPGEKKTPGACFVETEDGLLISAAVRDSSERTRMQQENDRIKDEFFATVRL